MIDYGEATEQKINEVIEACERSGKRSIIALAGVPGTGKSFIASIATQRFTDEPTLVREIQFHQSFSYEEFIEGMRIDNSGAVTVKPGVFLDWNDRAVDDPDRRYVLLIEELTRANLAAVLGELMTYIEHRERTFLTVYSRRPVRVAQNLTIVATYNPTDRSAIEIDGALLRRLRIIDFSPSTEQLSEMLGKNKIDEKVIDRLKMIFSDCKSKFPKHYEYQMPFGHGIFADINAESPDLYRLWMERIRHMLRRPLMEPHMFTDVIEQAYPWRNKAFVLS
jgi:5-methylcytosine-specific restriction endonuclease McrBC GTP-binding regulatory subunit McrB